MCWLLVAVGAPRFRVSVVIGFEQKSGSPVITIGLAIVDGLISSLV